MRPRYALLALCVAAAPAAHAQFVERSAEPVLMPVTKVQDATSKIIRIQHLGSGKVWERDQGMLPGRGAQVVAFDNLSNPCGDPNGVLNFSYSTAAGDRLCTCPIDPNQITFTSVFPMGADPCDDPNLTPGFVNAFPSAGIIDPLDIQWDGYSLDRTIAGDPNELKDIRRIDFSFFNLQGVFGPQPSANYQVSMLIAPFEFFDYDSSGTFDQTDGGVVVTFAFDGNAPGGLFTSSIDLDAAFGPNTPFLAYGDGLMVNDFANGFATAGNPLPACGVGNAFAGGLDNDPNCATPQDFVTVGSVDNLAGNFWLFANDTQGTSAGPPWDPNVTIADADGDPNALSYTDILTNGLLINITFGGLALDRPVRLYVDDAGGCSAGVDCQVPGGDADVDDDFDVDLSDLAAVLANFGSGGAAHGQGDTDFDGDVDLTDLANVLGTFGAQCPCP